MKPMTLIIIGTIILLIGTAISTIGNIKARSSAQQKLIELQASSDSLNIKSNLQIDEIQRILDENSSLQVTVELVNEQSKEQLIEVKQLRSENQELRIEVAMASKELTNQITGGSSFCFLNPIGTKKYAPLFNLMSQGKYAMYDINIRIVNLDKFEDKEVKNQININEMFKDDIILHFENLPPNAVKILGDIGLKLDGDYKRYNIFYSARNGFYTQLLRFKLVNGTWKAATIIKKEINGTDEILYERISNEFPKDGFNWK